MYICYLLLAGDIEKRGKAIGRVAHDLITGKLRNTGQLGA
jgi:hypothetical protein